VSRLCKSRFDHVPVYSLETTELEADPGLIIRRKVTVGGGALRRAGDSAEHHTLIRMLDIRGIDIPAKKTLTALWMI